ncbi:MAG: FtsW/RodA/SpoVE family cell cycle protein [Lachnospiraceae bacterium]|nr:FtsW/RodA/SpoVE family cell cycle protein [Lachnospiraceae bacterium]
MALYTYFSYQALMPQKSEEKSQLLYKKQTALVMLLFINGYIVILMHTLYSGGSEEVTSVSVAQQMLVLFLAQLVLLRIIFIIYKFFYRAASDALVNNMCLLLSVGFLILARLSWDKALRQFFLAVAAVVLTALIPLFVRKLKFLNKLAWLYAIIGIGGLGLVAVAGSTDYGAKLNISLGPVTIQPSEFIKILFVFFLAAMLYDIREMKQVYVATAIAGLHVLLLVAARDLGGAAIFGVAFLAMVYVATRRLELFLGGLGVGLVGAFLASRIFTHVQNRIVAWKDPLSVIDSQGYQVAQSLFAIGTGGWFGSGMYEGMPEKIPVVSKDFVFAAISEEMGGFFALCLIFVYINCFLMFFNISMQIRDRFYKLIALGLGTVYGIQTFLTLGGVIKFIPSTGVTLPLISYGGSSLLSTMILFAVIQGLYCLREDQRMTEELEDIVAKGLNDYDKKSTSKKRKQ